MNQKEKNDKEMVDNVITHFQSHTAEWQAIPPISESVDALNARKREIELSALVQEDGTSAQTAAKNLALDLCTDRAYKLTRRICAWARKSGHSEVVDAVDFTDSDLRWSAEDERILRFKLVIRYATEHKTELAAYKVTDAVIDELQTAVNTAEALKGKRDDKRNHKIFSTANIGEQIDKAKAILEILDDEVEGLIDNQAFIDTYFIARRKTDRRATRAKAAMNGQGA